MYTIVAKLTRSGVLRANLLQSGISVRIVRNSIANLLRGVISLPIGLLITPFIIAKIGTIAFGTWALANAFVSYANLLDLGISSALVRFVAQYKVKGDDDQINILLNTAFGIYAIMGVVAFCLLIAGKGWIIANFFHVEGEMKSDVSFVLVGCLLIFTANLAFSVFASLLDGLQRMDLTNTAAIAGVIINAIGTFIALNLGCGLRGLVIVSGAVGLVTIGLNMIMSRRVFKALTLNPLLFHPSYVKTLLGFSLQVQVPGLASLVHNQLDKIILGYFLGLHYVAYYEVASRVITYLRIIPLQIISPIMPAASELHADRNSKKVQALYYRSLKYMTVVIAPLFAFVAVFSYPLIAIWLGPGYELGAFATRYLAVANLASIMLTSPSFLITVGVGRPRYGVYSAVVGILLNVTLSVILTANIGFRGAVLGTSLSLILASSYFILLFHRALHLPARETTVKAIGYPTLTCLLVSLIVMGLSRYVHPDMKGLLFLGFIYCLFYLVTITKLPFLDRYDLEQIKRYARFAM